MLLGGDYALSDLSTPISISLSLWIELCESHYTLFPTLCVSENEERLLFRHHSPIIRIYPMMRDDKLRSDTASHTEISVIVCHRPRMMIQIHI